MSMQLRPYEPGDAAATLAVFLAAVTETAASDYSREQIDAWARPAERDAETWHRAMTARNGFVVTIGGEVAGFSDVADDGHIDMLFVAPAYQGRGVAGRLLAEAERRARAAGAVALTADVSITARPFFANHGFAIEREQHPVLRGVRMVNFRMRRPLQDG